MVWENPFILYFKKIFLHNVKYLEEKQFFKICHLMLKYDFLELLSFQILKTDLFLHARFVLHLHKSYHCEFKSPKINLLCRLIIMKVIFITLVAKKIVNVIQFNTPEFAYLAWNKRINIIRHLQVSAVVCPISQTLKETSKSIFNFYLYIISINLQIYIFTKKN